MSPLLRGVLVGAGVAATCLATLWLSLVAGTWLAVSAATGSPAPGRIVGALVLAGALAVVARAVALLTGDLRRVKR